MKTIGQFCMLTAVGAALLVATAPAQEKNTANRMTGDSTFATKAAQGGMAEVKLGNLAKEHASSQEVRPSPSKWWMITPKPMTS